MTGKPERRRLHPALGWVWLAAAALLMQSSAATLAWAGSTERVSVSSSGKQGFGETPSISADGRFVAFVSLASSLVPGDTNGSCEDGCTGFDVFVHDREAGRTERVSVSSSGAQGGGDSFRSQISADGRFVAFASDATNLAPGDTGVRDIFVRDRQTNRTERVSVSSSGKQANGASDSPAISADGRFIAFVSLASNLVSGDTNGLSDIFVRDRAKRTTARVSVSSRGKQGNDHSGQAELGISADGRFVTFVSRAGNLVAGDTNGTNDIFVRDRIKSTTTRVSVSSSGAQGDGDSPSPGTGKPVLSADGRSVAFASDSGNLVPGDTNATSDVFVHTR